MGADRPIVGTATTHKKRLQTLRKKLRARGFPEEVIEEIIRRRREAHAARREWARGEEPADLDDSAYQPTHVDPLLKGAARATGQTAAAVKRGRTITKHQHDQADGATS